MSDAFSCEVSPRLDVLSPAEWQRLFPGLLDSMELVRLVQDAGLDGFSFHSIVVRDAGRPILMLPIFETHYPLSTLVDGTVRSYLNAAAKWCPNLLTPRVMGVGFIEGEWGQVGVEPSLEPGRRDIAWDVALEALRDLADQRHAGLTAFAHFTSESGQLLPMHKLSDFSELVGMPYARVPIVYDDLEAYIQTLSAKMRADLRRKLRKAHDVKVVHTRNPGPWIETIYQLYLETVTHSDVVFGIHRRAYFERVCQEVPGAEYCLYFAEERLLAFKLIVVTHDCVVDKYFGMDHVLGREYNVYFVAWAELIRYCIERNIPLYYASQAEEGTKGRLGAQFCPSLILFKHRHALIHRLLTAMSQHFSYEPKVPLPRAQLGTGYYAQPSDTSWDATPLMGSYGKPLKLMTAVDGGASPGR